MSMLPLRSSVDRYSTDGQLTGFLHDASQTQARGPGSPIFVCAPDEQPCRSSHQSLPREPPSARLTADTLRPRPLWPLHFPTLSTRCAFCSRAVTPPRQRCGCSAPGSWKRALPASTPCLSWCRLSLSRCLPQPVEPLATGVVAADARCGRPPPCVVARGADEHARAGGTGPPPAPSATTSCIKGLSPAWFLLPHSPAHSNTPSATQPPVSARRVAAGPD